jgi:hypothetical protein
MVVESKRNMAWMDYVRELKHAKLIFSGGEERLR